MPITLGPSRTVVARKAHRCDCCNGIIAPRSAYDRAPFAYDGHAYTWKSCLPCSAISQEVWAWADPYGEEGIGFEDYVEWARAHEDDPVWGGEARHLLQRASLDIADIV